MQPLAVRRRKLLCCLQSASGVTSGLMDTGSLWLPVRNGQCEAGRAGHNLPNHIHVPSASITATLGENSNLQSVMASYETAAE